MRLAPAATRALRRGAAAAALASTATMAACEKKKEPKEPAPPKSLSELTTTLSCRHRQVFVSGTIDDELAKQVVAQLLFLDQEAPGEPIHMHINSSGGKVYAGLAIHGVMRAVRSPVHTTCLGHCESMAAVLLAAGEPGERCALKHARVMSTSRRARRRPSLTRSSSPPRQPRPSAADASSPSSSPRTQAGRWQRWRR